MKVIKIAVSKHDQNVLTIKREADDGGGCMYCMYGGSGKCERPPEHCAAWTFFVKNTEENLAKYTLLAL